MTHVRVKICGLKRRTELDAAVAAGASYVGLVFFGKSPRNIDLKTASDLVEAVPVGVCKVALTVNADDRALDQLLGQVPLDMLQLHGDETAQRVAEVKDRFGLPVMKAVGVRDETDLPALDDFAKVADQILVDAKPAKKSELPGGNGIAFDWRLIAGRRWAVPWMLAGGLTPHNIADAIRLTGARQVDVSSGVESAPGMKDPHRIQAFVEASKALVA